MPSQEPIDLADMGTPAFVSGATWQLALASTKEFAVARVHLNGRGRLRHLRVALKAVACARADLDQVLTCGEGVEAPW
jgi:hypothetical protein